MSVTTVDGRSDERGTFATLAYALRLAPEFREGLAVTVLLALLATCGRIVVPVAVQQTIDNGLLRPDGPDLGLVRLACALAVAAVLATAVANYFTNVRLYRATEYGLSALRVRAFRRVHDLSVLHQAAERRGSLVSRVTSDVDTLSMFMQHGGLLIVVSSAQVVLATVLMLFWSWQLTLVVYLCFVPLVFAVRALQRRLQTAYRVVRERVGGMLGVVAETVVGAPVIRAYAVQARTSERLDRAVDATRDAQTRALRLSAVNVSAGELTAALATAMVIVIGVLLGVAGGITAGRLVGFFFLVTLFIQPVQIATEVLNEAQNAGAGMRRVLGVLDTPSDVADPPDAKPLPPGPIRVRFESVGFAYPDGPEVLHDVDLELTARSRVAVVGETGSGKTTFAKLLTRLMDPSRGRVLLSGVPLDELSFDSLRSRVVMVPQDGFLFDSTVAANVRYGRLEATDDDIALAFHELGLTDWLEQLPDGLHTAVGERGESLSVGERQLVAIARAYIADPDLLVLDEATSAVDPATEVRLQRALDSLTRGRTTLAIAHRLSTAEAADEILVVDAGRIVQRGPHRELVAVDGVYARLHASWITQSR